MKKFLSAFPININSFSKEELFNYFQNSWHLSNILYSSVDISAMYKSPDERRHPLIFYFAHSAVFYINKLVKSGLIDRGVNEHFEKLFAKGVDPEKTFDLDTNIDWPSYSDILDYREKVFEIVSRVIESLDLSTKADFNSKIWALFMGIDHDRIHFETSSVLIRQYPLKFLSKPIGWKYADLESSIHKSKFIEIPGGKISWGKSYTTPYFGWDNEYGCKKTNINSFKVSNSLVSNHDYLEFVKDKGYDKPNLWCSKAQKWLLEENPQHPKFWLKEGNNYRYRAMYDVLDLPQNWPVEVNWFEADAYCRWKGRGTRLISEAEFEKLAQYCQIEDSVFFKNIFNLNFQHGSPQSVNISLTRDIYDLYGNVFQWIDNEFYPLEGFKEHPLYPDFSSPYFGEKHRMLRGGSWASSGASMLRYYRLWFRSDFFQHAGFRIVQ